MIKQKLNFQLSAFHSEYFTKNPEGVIFRGIPLASGQQLINVTKHEDKVKDQMLEKTPKVY